MNSKLTAAETRVRLVTRAILTVGLASAVVILIINVLAPDPSGFELEESKKYLRDVEVVGGTANLLATEFRQWFGGLWHGKSLALTVAVISVLLALVYNFLAMPLPAGVDGDAGRGTSGPGGAGE